MGTAYTWDWVVRCTNNCFLNGVSHGSSKNNKRYNIDNLLENDRTARKVLDASITSTRKHCQKIWKEHTYRKYMKYHDHVLLGKNFRPLSRKQKRDSWQTSYKNNNNLSPYRYFVKLTPSQSQFMRCPYFLKWTFQQ